MPNCLNIFGRGRSVRRTLRHQCRSVSTFYDGAEVSNGHFGTGAELSWVRNVQGPKCPYTVTKTAKVSVSVSGVGLGLDPAGLGLGLGLGLSGLGLVLVLDSLVLITSLLNTMTYLAA